MARCGDCNKFVSYDQQDPEVEDLEVSDSGEVTAAVRIVNACDQCGTELRESTLEMSVDLSERLAGHLGSDEGAHELAAEETSSERTERQEGRGRGARTFYGAKVEFKVTCSCGELEEVTGDLEDDVQASSMDEV